MGWHPMRGSHCLLLRLCCRASRLQGCALGAATGRHGVPATLAAASPAGRDCMACGSHKVPSTAHIRARAVLSKRGRLRLAALPHY